MKKDYINDIENAERRFISPQIEIRAEGETNTIEGIAAVVNKTTDLGWYEERIEPGAFDDVLNDDVRALFNHDPNFVLARSKGGKGTLSLSIDKTGNLKYSYKTPDRSFARDLQDAIKAGDVDQSSFAFSIKEEKWEFAGEENGRNKDLRTILKVERLYDISPVTYPAYQDTTVAARSKESLKNESNETKEQIKQDQIDRDKFYRNQFKK
jgi:HK97 family phage prohead protease